jgi:hypothetical protein
MEDATGFGVRLTICYGRGAPFLPRLLMAVHDPTPDFVEFLLNVFSTLGIQPTLSSAEFAFDVTPVEGQLLPLQRRIASTLFLPYQHKHKPAGSYQDLTYYTTNVRTAAKGHRVYRKAINEREVIRVELVMGRARLKAMGITLGNLLSTQPQALRQYVQFRSMNLDRLAAYLIRKMGYRDGQPVSTGTCKPHATQLVRSAWRSALSVDMGNSVMAQYGRLRMEQCVKSHGRFLDKHAAFEEEFWEAVLINYREEES